MQHHLHWRAWCSVLGKRGGILISMPVILLLQAVQRNDVTFLWMKIGRKEPSNISLSSLDEVSMVISLTFSDTPMKPLFSFYASQHPCFLVSRQWDWFDWCSCSMSQAGWSPPCGGYLHSSGRTQRDPWRDRRDMRSLYCHCVPWSRWHCWALLLWDAQVDTGTFTWVKPRRCSYSQEEGVLGEDASTQGRGRTTGSLATFACFLKVYGFRCHQLRRLKMLCNLILTKLIPIKHFLVVEDSRKDATAEKDKSRNQGKADASQRDTQFVQESGIHSNKLGIMWLATEGDTAGKGKAWRTLFSGKLHQLCGKWPKWPSMKLDANPSKNYYHC